MKLKEIYQNYYPLFLIFGSMGFTVSILLIGIGVFLFIVVILGVMASLLGNVFTLTRG
jgi:hypothetical protein